MVILESVQRLEKTLHLLDIEPWLYVRQADALTADQTMLTNVFYFLFLLISYVNYSTSLIPNLVILESVQWLEKTLNLLDIESWLYV